MDCTQRIIPMQSTAMRRGATLIRRVGMTARRVRAQVDTNRPDACPGDLLRDIQAGILRLVQGEIAMVRAEIQ